MTSLLLLTGCVKVSFTGPKKKRRLANQAVEKEPLTFVRAEQYKDQDNEVLEASEKFIKEHPTLGEAGKLFVFFQDIPLEMRKIASPYSLLWIVPPQPSIVMDPLSWIWNMMESHF